MKKLLYLFPVIMLFIGFTTERFLDDKLKNLLKQFNVSEQNAKDNIFSDVSGPSFYIPNVKMLKDLAIGDRASMVEAVGNNVKEYTSSKEFTQKYNEFRENRKPSPPEKPKSAAEQKKEYQDNMNKSIAEMKKSKSQAAKDQQGMFDDIIKNLEQQLKDIDDPNNPMFSPELDTYSQQGYQLQVEQYNKELANWEAEYPVNNQKPIVKKWLETFLNNSKDIDFNAQLKTQNGKQVFVNPEYERKNYEWKLYFRAGKEPVETARKFVQSWLNEIK